MPMINFGLVPGAASVSMLMRRHLDVELTEEQANELWVECLVLLKEARFTRTISAAQSAYYGCVDRFAQAELSGVIWKALTGIEKPVAKKTGSPDSCFELKVQSALSQRGYAKAQNPISMLKRVG